MDRLKFIQGAQRLGLRLRDIADLLVVRDTGVCPCEPAEELLRRRLAEVDAEMARLAALRAEMVAMVEALPSANCPRRRPERGVHRHGREVTAMLELIGLSCCCDDPDCPPDCGCDCC